MDLSNIRFFSTDHPTSNESFNSTSDIEYEEYYKRAEDLSERLDVICSGYAHVIVGLLGTIGNLLSIIVLSQPKMRVTSLNILLNGQQISDFLYVITQVFLVGFPQLNRSINGSGYGYIGPVIFLVICNNLLYITEVTSKYFTIFITIERYIAICYPLHAASWLSPKRAIYGSLIITLFSIIVCSPGFFIHLLQYDENGFITGLTYTEFYKSSLYGNYYIKALAVVLYVVPFTSLIILNTTIFQQLRMSLATRRSLRTNKESERNSLTFMLFGIVITFFLCNINEAICQVTFYHFKRWPVWILLFIYPFTNLLLVINSSVNFIFYCVFGAKFRLELSKLIKNCPLFWKILDNRKIQDQSTTFNAFRGRQSTLSIETIL